MSENYQHYFSIASPSLSLCQKKTKKKKKENTKKPKITLKKSIKKPN